MKNDKSDSLFSSISFQKDKTKSVVDKPSNKPSNQAQQPRPSNQSLVTKASY